MATFVRGGLRKSFFKFDIVLFNKLPVWIFFCSAVSPNVSEVLALLAKLPSLTLIKSHTQGLEATETHYANNRFIPINEILS